ncbi:GntR family transcriptional regulator [Phytoactinopolyspora limicola]|uniref:GntR family transcriptional regulator n=1 Tax=Phytoactinopolyspora limicola TaxID=2715536 RepID=UPI00140C8A64|nr:GntR family transcriptional regulator [Phytoactinopolyspora limicola]
MTTATPGDNSAGSDQDTLATGDTESPAPKYLAIAAELADRYRALPSGTQLPTEKELAAEFGVSRMTVRHALQRLGELMVVTRLRGRGTFVQHLIVAKDQNLTSFTEDMKTRGVVPSTRLVALEEVEAALDVTGELGLPPGTRMVRAQRLRFGGDEAICHETVHLPGALAAQLKAQDYESSLHGALRNIGTAPVIATRRTSAIALPSHVARLLQVPVGSPALRVVHVFRDEHATPLYVAESYYRADRYEIVTTIRRDRP